MLKNLFSSGTNNATKTNDPIAKYKEQLLHACAVGDRSKVLRLLSTNNWHVANIYDVNQNTIFMLMLYKEWFDIALHIANNNDRALCEPDKINNLNETPLLVTAQCLRTAVFDKRYSVYYYYHNIHYGDERRSKHKAEIFDYDFADFYYENDKVYFENLLNVIDWLIRSKRTYLHQKNGRDFYSYWKDVEQKMPSRRDKNGLISKFFQINAKYCEAIVEKMDINNPIDPSPLMETILIKFCKTGEWGNAQKLIKNNFNCMANLQVGAQDANGYTALYWSLKNLNYGYMSTVANELIDSGLSCPELMGDDQNTTLIIACKNTMSGSSSQNTIIKLLQTGKCDMNYKDKDNKSIIDYVIINNLYRVKNYIEKLYDNEFNEDYIDDQGNTRLMIMAKHGMTDSVKKYIETDSKYFERENTQHFTVLHYLVKSGHDHIALELIEMNDYKYIFVDAIHVLLLCSKLTLYLKVKVKVITILQNLLKKSNLDRFKLDYIYNDATTLMNFIRLMDDKINEDKMNEDMVKQFLQLIDQTDAKTQYAYPYYYINKENESALSLIVCHAPSVCKTLVQTYLELKYINNQPGQSNEKKILKVNNIKMMKGDEIVLSLLKHVPIFINDSDEFLGLIQFHVEFIEKNKVAEIIKLLMDLFKGYNQSISFHTTNLFKAIVDRICFYSNNNIVLDDPILENILIEMISEPNLKSVPETFLHALCQFKFEKLACVYYDYMMRNNIQNQINYVNPVLGTTPLMLATKNNMVTIAAKLLDHPSSNQERIDRDGNTALIFACKNKMYDVASKLITNRVVNITQTNSKGESARSIVKSNQLSQLCELIDIFAKPITISIPPPSIPPSIPSSVPSSVKSSTLDLFAKN